MPTLSDAESEEVRTLLHTMSEAMYRAFELVPSSKYLGLGPGTFQGYLAGYVDGQNAREEADHADAE